jgi:hypothetical protein
MDYGEENNEDLKSKAIELQILRGKEILSEEDVEYFIKHNDYVDEVYTQLERWTIITNVYYKFGDRYYLLTYAKAATEEQEDEFWSQFAVEVKKIQGPVWKVLKDYEK